MKLSQFILMNEGEKAKTLLNQGILVSKIKEKPMIRFLFQMDDYYVELCCDASQKEVKTFNAFTDTRQLQPFLEQIPLNDLL